MTYDELLAALIDAKAERDAALAERDAAKGRAEYWKANHLAGNEEIDRLTAALATAQAEVAQLRADLVDGQLHAAGCPYEASDREDALSTCTCQPEQLAVRWKAQWLVMKMRREIAEGEVRRLMPIVEGMRDYLAVERARRDAKGQGGQHTGPSINVRTLQRLERLLRDPPPAQEEAQP